MTDAADAADAADADAALDEFIGERGKTRDKRPYVAPASLRRHEDAARESLQSGDWSSASALTFVALHGLMHQKIYGVGLGLTPGERLSAARAAGRMLKDEFGGDPSAMAAFMRWTWRREKEREEWRRKNARDGGSVGWRLQFGRHVLTDYRLAAARRGGQ